VAILELPDLKVIIALADRLLNSTLYVLYPTYSVFFSSFTVGAVTAASAVTGKASILIMEAALKDKITISRVLSISLIIFCIKFPP
jgi:hypothetical protein